MACTYFGAVLPKTADGARFCWLFLDGLTLHGDSEENQKKQMKVFYVHNVVDKLMCGLFLSLDNLDSLVVSVSDDVERSSKRGTHRAGREFQHKDSKLCEQGNDAR